MKVSLGWLRDFVRIEAAPEEIAMRLTLAGLEVEALSRVGDAQGIVVAEVQSIRKHPDAVALTLVTVTDGRETAEVVCGATNVPAAGGKVAWARPGARLPGLGVIEPRRIRGVLSPGMLCAEDELGLSEDHTGIVILPGKAQPGADALEELRDVVFEINVTTNRPDCLGHYGIAREVAALYQLPLAPLAAPASAAGPLTECAIEIEDARGCPRYMALAASGVGDRASPASVQRRLRAVGVRPISAVVDATNYVVMETGQPLHAFDLDRLAGPRIIVRRARPGERMKTLDDVERALEPSDLVIADADHAVGLAGIMGGADTEVSGATRRVLLECAHFDPATVRRTAKRLGLHTEASHRFERGTDPNQTLAAAAWRCIRLIAEWSGAEIASGMTDHYPGRIAPAEVGLRPSRARTLLGIDLSDRQIADCLVRLGLAVQPGSTLQVTVPTFRPDVTREVDLIEEVGRVHGYAEIPADLPQRLGAPRAAGDPIVERARDALAAAGLDEAITYGFTSVEKIGWLGLLESDLRARPVPVKNPLREETAVMRTSLAPGLLSALSLNLARGAGNARLFEIGTIFLTRPGEPLPDERRTAAAILAGARPSWLSAAEPVDFFDLKGVLDQLAEGLGLPELELEQTSEVPYLHPGVAARVGDLGVLGEVHPEIARRFGVETRCFYFEIDLERVPALAVVQAQVVPRFPAIDRDVSFFIDADVPAAVIRACVREAREPLLVEVAVREDWRDPERVPAGQKSMLYAMKYRSAERTLTDEEVALAHSRVIEHLRQRLRIELR
jgi:phenylalanyl-tRNA synthetase beta chain